MKTQFLVNTVASQCVWVYEFVCRLIWTVYEGKDWRRIMLLITLHNCITREVVCDCKPYGTIYIRTGQDLFKLTNFIITSHIICSCHVVHVG